MTSMAKKISRTKKIAIKSLGAIKEYPEVDEAHMGFPENWQNEPLWS